MADVELLPLHYGELPEVPADIVARMQSYARANVAHATAPLQAEIEALRAEVERLRRLVQERDAMLGRRLCSGTNADGKPRCLVLAEERARAERLAEALRWAERHCPCGARPESPDTHPHLPGCLVGAALAQENRND